jgi:hypothetical protein
MSEKKSYDGVIIHDPEVNNGECTPYTDSEAERAYVKKIDYIVLPVLCLVSVPYVNPYGKQWLINALFLR